MMMNPVSDKPKLFFFDIDGTLANRHSIPEENLKALQLLKDKGHLTFICTGRPAFYPNLLFGDLPYGAVCSSGGSITIQNEEVYHCPLRKEQLDWLDFISREHGFGILLNTAKGVVCWNMNEYQQKQVEFLYDNQWILQTDDPKSWGTKAANFDLMFNDKEQLEKVRPVLETRYVLNMHGPHPSCDCALADAGKGEAIAWLQKHFGISKEDTYAFGDGHNDLSMFRSAGHRIAMGNAVDELKEQATFISKDCMEGGVVYGLIHEGILAKEDFETKEPG